MSVPSVEIPQYRCHKVVRAAKITALRPNGIDGAPDLVLGEIGGITTMLPDWHAKHQPHVGGYFVLYEDGYQSFSPAKAFEDGYTSYSLSPAIEAGCMQVESEPDKIERIARVCHEVNRAYCAAIGDLSQPAWEDAPAWQRESARVGVDLHLRGDFGPEASHASWMQNKLDHGWAYGPTKDEVRKTHPCMVPFAELPREQQAKDYIFRAVVHALRGARD